MIKKERLSRSARNLLLTIALIIFMSLEILPQKQTSQPAKMWHYVIILFSLSILSLLVYYIIKKWFQKKHRELLNKELKKKNTDLQEAIKLLKETREQLIQSEKMASLGQLTAGIAHEIKNPLNFVINFAELSMEHFKELREIIWINENLPQKNKDLIVEILNDIELDLSKIKEHGNRIDAIIRGMLLHSRGKKEKFQPVDLNALLEENIGLVYHSMRAQDQSFNVTFEKDFDPQIGEVWVDFQDFSRALLNVLSNACYTTNEKRKKGIRDYSPLVSIKTKKTDQKIEIRIKDNGLGIQKQEKDKIFTPFYTTKPLGLGTGLGLFITQKIIRQGHKGEIHVESKPDEFSEFIITIPSQMKQSK